MSSLNKVILVGNLGSNPDIKTTQAGVKIANLSLATSESWHDKSTKERQTKTEWHRVVIFGALAGVCEKYLKKGSKIVIEGKLTTRKWNDNGVDKYTTEIIVSGFGGNMTMLDSAGTNNSNQSNHYPDPEANNGDSQASKSSQAIQDDDDEIPF